MPLLTNDAWRTHLSRAIDEAGANSRVQLVAFVYMPEHVHLLVLPHGTKEDISSYLSDLKVDLSQAVKADLEARPNRLLQKLTIRERPGKTVFRYWHEGDGYDRNMFSRSAIMHAIDCIHENPLRRKLCSKLDAWRWSSYRYYASDGQVVDEALPKIEPLSAEYLLALDG
jgi:putative transposase